MAETYRNNPIAVRHVILYEFLKGKPVYKAYQKFCKTLGDDFLTYPDFEYWYMRFSSGEFDLNYDRNLDPKCRTFTDLPEDVFEEIGSYLSSNERFILRDVSKKIRRIIDSWKPDVVDMHFWSYMANNERRKYACFLKNPKLELDALEVYKTDFRSTEMVVSVSKEMRHQVRVKYFVMEDDITNIVSVISKLETNTLKHVDISINDKSIDNMNKFLQMDQVKELVSLVIHTDLESSEFPLKCFYDYPDFVIKFMCVTKYESLISFVMKLVEKDTNFRRCRLNFNRYQHLSEEEFSKKGTPVPTLRNTRHIPIQGTDDAYKLKFSNYCFTIVRRGKDDDSDPDSDFFHDSDSSSFLDFDLDD